MQVIKKVIRKFLKILGLLKLQKFLKEYYVIKSTYFKHIKALQRVRSKTKFKVVFFVIHDSVWKYDELYNLMENDERFFPIVLICPYVRNTEEVMFEDMDRVFNSFVKKGINAIKAFDSETEKWVNVKKDINPDFIFFTNPHFLTKREYYINNFLDTLTCYVPYSFQVSNLYQAQFNQLFHSLVWKQFYETDFHKSIGEKYSRTKGKNIVVTGYPIVDRLLKNKDLVQDPWPIKDTSFKRIIWAPHHTITENDSALGYSSFKQYADLILKFVTNNQFSIQIAFKPHPLLKQKLYADDDWGKKRTDDYFTEWENLKNGFIYNFEYSSLFIHSDAMIHDSGSFAAEYLLVNKPVMFMVSHNNVFNNFSEFGKKCLGYHYIGKNWMEIEEFLYDIINSKPDIIEKDRHNFVTNFCLPPNNTSASNNIFQFLISNLK